MSTSGAGPAWSIDGDVRPAGWDEEVRKALAPMHQGRLIAGPPTVYYAAPDRPLTETTSRWADRTGATGPGPVAPRAQAPWGIVTTQTCDLIEEGSPKRPWFTAAPVYVYPCSEGTAAQIAQGNESAYLFAVTTLGLRPEGLWVADLRLEIPIEKGWLVGRRTQGAFASQREYIDFAERLGHLRTRFAYPRDLDVLFLRPCLEKLKLLGEQFGLSFEARYEAGKDRNDPDTVRLVLISEEAAPPEVHAEVQQWWTATFAQEGLTLNVLEPCFARYAELDPREYELMMRFNLPALGG